MANGHQFSELGHYTARQLILFYEKSLLRARRERAARATDCAVGFSGGSDLTNYIKDLTD
ncbi:hypothetical protein BKL51_06130 [Rodentibacter sp. Ppn85]|nr:hypothetical protein BKL51_06130 [Rodentibacter sp. Ppn85]